ncbi:MAG: Gfo/Idh/MocA family oxidoreductase [Lachnospiraceae bacterium]|jgi:predicted dehydrogenase|nr:Gfo/Idh/MocA family oxidoreductase [Lachnospiraceae bacterium]
MIRIGVICPSEIALRRFMPALSTLPEFSFAGLAISAANERGGEDEENITAIIAAEKQKAQEFIASYGGKIFTSYEEIATSDEIDALYIPLPPALHFRWAQLALEHQKHVLVEKPATLRAADTQKLVTLAEENELALHENYMFVFHKQIAEIMEIVANGEIGAARLYRMSFGFPRRPASDFRYSPTLGGGALYDCGGYTMKLAQLFLGETARLTTAQSNYLDDFAVDMYGSATMINDNGDTAHLSFGMDHDYRCELDIWGSSGSLHTNRILTAPVGFAPQITVKRGGESEIRNLSPDDSFAKSLAWFAKCMEDKEIRKESYRVILAQAQSVDEFKCIRDSSNEKGTNI